MSALDISQQDIASTPSPAASPVSSPNAADKAAVPAVDDVAAQPVAAEGPRRLALSPNERRGLLIVVGVALFQEVHSNVFRGVLVGAAAATALYSQRGCIGCK